MTEALTEAAQLAKQPSTGSGMGRGRTGAVTGLYELQRGRVAQQGVREIVAVLGAPPGLALGCCCQGGLLGGRLAAAAGPADALLVGLLEMQEHEPCICCGVCSAAQNQDATSLRGPSLRKQDASRPPLRML